MKNLERRTCINNTLQDLVLRLTIKIKSCFDIISSLHWTDNQLTIMMQWHSREEVEADIPERRSEFLSRSLGRVWSNKSHI